MEMAYSTPVVDAFEGAVLLTGRGGAGTRLLSQLAVDAGVFIGNEVNRSGDSTEWTELTYRMVADVGGQRNLPSGSRYRREIRATAERIVAAAPGGHSGRWGLKLPELMLVLPLFDQPGGGLLDMDTYVRACELPDAELVMLLGEGTFHQMHGGVTTSASADDARQRLAAWSAEYTAIRKVTPRAPGKEPHYLGHVPRPALRSILVSARGSLARLGEGGGC
jgi:hypothetical protein